MSPGRSGFTTRASCLIAAGATALACGLLLGIVDLARAGVLTLAVPLLSALVVLRSRVLIANGRRAEPARAVAGEAVVMHLTISNRSLLPTSALMLEDQLPGQLHGSARFVLDGLQSRESRTVSYRMPRLPRGRYRVGPLHIRLTDPFHLIDVRRSFTATNEIVVAPVVEAVRGVHPPRSLDVGDNAGSHSIGTHGADDASTREYRLGDDLRKIHWRSSARTGLLMVRQEERPWQGQLTVLLDLRSDAHVEGPADPAVEDERVRSSLEWAISAAATVATYGLLTGREVGLVADLAAPARLPMIGTGQVAEHLAMARASSLATLDPLDGLLAAVARESTIIAVLGDLDARSLRLLAGVHPRGTSSSPLALLLDTTTWAAGPRATGPGAAQPETGSRAPGAAQPETGSRAPSARQPPTGSRAHDAARVLRSAGWQTLVVRCGDGVGAAAQSLLTPRGVAAMSGLR